MNLSTSSLRPLLALGVGVALTLAACGGDDDDLAATAVPPTEAAETAEAGDSEALTISIADFAFSGVTEVPVGTTIVVSNDDGTPHTWTAEDGTFDSGALAGGESFEFTFTETGQFSYFCNFHPSMTGRITVTS